jgi:sec-independent protein translocase protein TatB
VSNLGSGEILVILVLALIVLGPERLPEAARKIGGVVRQVRQLSNGFQQEVKRAMDFTDGDKPFTPEEARIRPLPDRTGDGDASDPYETDVRAVHPEPFTASDGDDDRPDDQRAAG